MALAARQTQMIRGDNGVNVGRMVDTVVDERTGVAAQRERVIAAVPDEHGNVIVMMQERIRAVKVPPMIGNAVGRGEITAPEEDDREKPGACSLCNFCCMLCFLPCLTSKICLTVFAILVLIPAIILIAITAVGPIHCTTTSLAVPASAVTIALIGVILFILLLCICIQCCKGEDSGPCRAIIYCCNCLAIITLLGLIIAGSVLVFLPKDNIDPDCSFLATPIATIALSYAFVISTCCCWCLCCYAVLKGGNNNE